MRISNFNVSQSGCIRFLGHFCQFPQHNFAANSGECCRTCWIGHICFQEQAGMICSNMTVVLLLYFVAC
jgi:hypothetical protein